MLEITRLGYGLYILRILKFALNFIVLQSQLTIRFIQVTESNLLRFLGYERLFFRQVQNNILFIRFPSQAPQKRVRIKSVARNMIP